MAHQASPSVQKGAPLEGNGPVAAELKPLRTNPQVNYAPNMALEPTEFGSRAEQVRNGHTTRSGQEYDDPRLLAMGLGSLDDTLDPPIYMPESNTGIQGVKRNPHGYAGLFDQDYQRRKR